MKSILARIVSVAAFSIFIASFAFAAPPKKGKYNAEATKALLQAAADGDENAILEQLAAGADPNARDENENSVLALAVMNSMFGKEKEIVDALVKAKVPIDGRNKFGQTALMLAAREGRWGNIEPLLAAGADVNAKSNDGWNAVMIAAYNGHVTEVDNLIKAKADFKAKDADGWDALMLAISEGRGAAAEKLVAAGAALGQKNPNGTPMLVSAVFGGDLAGVRLVLENGQPDVNSTDKDGWPGVEIAAYNGAAQILMELLRAGSDPSIKDKEGKTALDRAIQNENLEIVALLGGEWKKPALTGTRLGVPCDVLGGNVDIYISIDDDALVFSTAYPKPLNYYLGGGFTNRAKSAKKFAYDGAIAPKYYLDTDANPKTGRKAGPVSKEAAGADYTLDYSELGTSVSLKYQDSDGNELQKPVYANVLDVTLEKGEESMDSEAMGDYSPFAQNDVGIVRTTVPMKLILLKTGQKIGFTAKIGNCAPKQLVFKVK